ncbi:ligand-binding sensor domain-containing protein [Prevotella aff. ruminicola Tc2-24]|uniref:Ligand-binding sensor domain-containing protein n=1 Tax=Prevotella aff. ruminicola Tc2-24 TaxID=81582 RepID=A0A1I0MJX0_9BACT|nr:MULTISPECIES: two-component regulator propeller domain-containing protein [Prevotella]MBR5989330.1 helix-turn-helix domain-containing protein [Prevotella sp.]SEE13874.1 ligand-binding sensor domain-containing protein [Prevotella sp. lc2012]SEV88595.1 ligand-binding sensor domain-containing protein [Prevotella aff. ruminicola Tc2-24]
MKTTKKILLILLLFLPLAVIADHLFKTLDAHDGLTSSQVNCILKDSRGYVWFGTPAGLYRFDGYTFKNFQSDSQDGSSLNDSYINSIQETLDGNLLVETSSGYCIYHPQTESFERDMKQSFARMGIETIPSVVFIDRHKNLWGAIPNKGVVCYNQQQQLLYEFGYTDDAHGVPQGVICSISECRDGAIIVYDDGRMVCCDVMHQQHTVWATQGLASLKRRKNKSLRAYADQMDNIWLYGQGTLAMYNKGTDSWDTSIGDQLGLTGVGVDRNINGMAGDRNGNIWIGSDQLGLLKMNVHTHVVEAVQPRNINDSQWIKEKISIQSVYVDDTDLIWVGTEKSGVAYSGNYIYRFGSNLNGDITAIAQDANGTIWYGTSDKGVIGYEGVMASKKVATMATTPDGSLWVGSKRNGLTRIKNGTSTIYSLAKDSTSTLIDDHINALCTDKIGNLWIATNGGLQVYNPRMNTFSSYTRENGKLNTNNITSLYYNHHGKSNDLYIGTSEGLVILNLSTTDKTVLTGNTTNTKSFTNNFITQVLQDSRGLIWIGTREGLNILNLENDTLNYLTEKQGLCNNNICGIAEDKNHSIWVTTSSGVSRIVVQRNHEDGSNNYGLYNYTTADGLQSNEFNPGSILTRQDGNVLLGGLYGVNWVLQKTSDDNDALPRVMLTQLFIGEEEILTGHEYNERIVLPQALNETNKLVLGHNQNTFTIKFAAGNYNQSERLQFMYWMEGKDEDWRNGNALTHGVTFKNLKSGKYILHVKAISAEGAVSNQERRLEIIIEPHWLLSWWMILAYIILALVVIYFWRIGIKQLAVIKARKKAVIRELTLQREEIKAASEDLRQPMARMTSIIGNLSEKEKSLEEKEQLNALHSQMLQIITRVSDMQTNLENPEERAKNTVQDRLELNGRGEIELPEIINQTLTSDAGRSRAALDTPTMKFTVVMIDDNEEFLKFATARLQYVYDFHAYDDIEKAATDLDEMRCDIVVCKQDMKGMTGSDLCNQLKMDMKTQNIKFVLMTEGVLTPQDMRSQNITLSADDYLAKPFNLQEASIRLNKLLGLGPIEMNSNLIEGAETRMLEDRNSSMTTATESYSIGEYSPQDDGEADADDPMNKVDTKIIKRTESQLVTQVTEEQEYGEEQTLSDYSMLDAMDQQLLRNIEQYVMQNMSRGQISLEEMATAMGMGRVPFFHRVRNLTSKTPAELVRDMRLKHACILLKRTNINMSELASNIGFMTAENFINIFKEKFGMTPLEYRLKHRK